MNFLKFLKQYPLIRCKHLAGSTERQENRQLRNDGFTDDHFRRTDHAGCRSAGCHHYNCSHAGISVGRRFLL
mgnify:CR=1 FL=1